MRELKTVYWTTKLVLIALWPVSALAAAGGSLSAGLVYGSLLPISATLLLSTTAGLTALLVQIKKDLEQHNEIQHVKLYVASKMMASNTAGLFIYFMTAERIDTNYQAGAILIASFGGTLILNKGLKLLEHLMDKFWKEKI